MSKTTANSPIIPHRYSWLWLLAAMVFLVAGCAPPPAVDTTTAEQRLEQAQQAGDPVAKAEALMELADAQSGLTRADQQMQALETLIDARNWDALAELEPDVDTQMQWSGVDNNRAKIIEAALAHAQSQDIETTLTQIRNLPVPLPEAVAKRRLLVIAHIYQDKQDWVDAARQFSLLADRQQPPALNQTQADLWNALMQADTQALEQRRNQTRDGIFAGWLELALLHQNRPGRIPNWADGNPNHPAVTHDFIAVISDAQPEATVTISDHKGPIAILLPRDERFTTAVEAIYAGIQYAKAADPRLREHELILLDTGTEKERLHGAIRAATDRGASLIIGPLLREQIPMLAEYNQPRPPILALNQPPSGERLPSGVVSFALSPEADARAIAERMMLDGRNNALVFAANDDNANRARDAFIREYTLLGGNLLEQATFEANQTDFSQQLRRLLQVRSQQSSGPFIPEIRSDADGIFIAANARQLNLVVPQLDYFGADQLPRYGLGLTWAGQNNPQRDLDKSGTIIPTEPVLLSADRGPDDAMRQAFEQALMQTDQPRLFAFGADAIAAGSQLEAMQQDQVIDGLTGRLSLSINNVIERTPAYGQFIGGRVEPAIDPRTGQLPSTVIDYNQRAREQREQESRRSNIKQTPEDLILPDESSPISTPTP